MGDRERVFEHVQYLKTGFEVHFRMATSKLDGHRHWWLCFGWRICRQLEEHKAGLEEAIKLCHEAEAWLAEEDEETAVAFIERINVILSSQSLGLHRTTRARLTKNTTTLLEALQTEPT